jgi:hypothetical protein
MRTFSPDSLVSVATIGTKRSYQPGLKTVFLLMYFRTEGVGVMGHRLCAHVATFSAKPHTRYTHELFISLRRNLHASGACWALHVHGHRGTWGGGGLWTAAPNGFMVGAGQAITFRVHPIVWSWSDIYERMGRARWPRSHCMFCHARPFQDRRQ